jgi:hypothetical protein
MKIIGCDFHPSWQQITWLDMETGETGEQKLVHARGEAKQFYQQLAAPALIGMEATGNSQWLIELVQDLGHEIWIGDAAQIRASYVRKQKTDKRDAAHILKLVVEGRFPKLCLGATMSGMNSHELEYRRSGRLLIVLVVAFVPVVWVVGLVCVKLLHNEVGFATSAGLLIAAMIFLSVRRFIALYRWKGKYPFDWLRR